MDLSDSKVTKAEFPKDFGELSQEIPYKDSERKRRLRTVVKQPNKAAQFVTKCT
jgi:hypothetical protein